MTINTKPMVACIDRIFREDGEMAKPQCIAVDHIRNIIKDAQSCAYSYPPQASFTYTAAISSALAEKLTANQLKALAKVGIQLSKTAGMSNHKVNLSFQS